MFLIFYHNTEYDPGFISVYLDNTPLLHEYKLSATTVDSEYCYFLFLFITLNRSSRNK